MLKIANSKYMSQKGNSYVFVLVCQEVGTDISKNNREIGCKSLCPKFDTSCSESDRILRILKESMMSISVALTTPLLDMNR